MDDRKKLLESIKRGILRIMKMRTKSILNVTLFVLLIAWAGSLCAGERGTYPSMVPETAYGASAYVEPFGVPLAPGIYLANFMILYFVKPEVAANMPAYRAALPQEVYECLVENPNGVGCPYTDMAKYFAEQALEIGGSRNSNTFWPNSCQIDRRWEALVPPEYRQPDQINQPLGRKKADKLARLLSMDQDMILTDEQYECMMGIDPPSNEDGRDIIRACLDDLTNSKVAEVIIPLSSYGLSLDDDGNVRSNCAPGAPCLEFNQLAINGSLDAIAEQCDFVEKLQRLIDPSYTKTPFPELLLEGVKCQKEWGPESGLPCIVENTSPGKGGQ